jgi:hypothetical protein
MLFINSCKKEDVAEPINPTGQIKKIIYTDHGDTTHTAGFYTFKYENNIIKEIISTEKLTEKTIEFRNGKVYKNSYIDEYGVYRFSIYTYSGDSIIQMHYSQSHEWADSTFWSKDKYIINENGRITERYHAVEEDDPWGNPYQYYFWENGNMIEKVESNHRYYMFYTDKESPLKDIVIPSYDLFNGSKMLLSEQQFPESLNVTYSYKYDDNGYPVYAELRHTYQGTIYYCKYYYEYY